MNLKLRAVEDLAEARRVLPFLERAALESLRALSLSGEPQVAALLERDLAASETLVLVAEAREAPEPWAALVCAPFQDPLSQERSPLIVALWVDPRVRHRGVARALIEEARRRLAARGHRQLMARASHNDDALISMGERIGFVRAWELMALE